MRLFEQYFELPFKHDIYGSHIFDYNNNIALQFYNWDINPQSSEEIMSAINYGTFYSDDIFTYDRKAGCISQNDTPIILIRGWGYLTGTGGLNLSDAEAVKIQDSLAEYIIEKLTQKP